MSNNFNTHVITNYSDPKRGSVLSRKSDGMVLGRRAGCLVAWGEDPREQQQRVFTDETWALCFLRKIADVDQQHIMKGKGIEGDALANIEEADGDRKILAAGVTQ